MAKKHIIRFGYRDYAVDSLSAASDAMRILSKLQPCRHNIDAEDSREWHYEPDSERDHEIRLKTNQLYHEPRPVKPSKTLALPKPMRGTIRCICDKSDVAPRTSCAHCGRPFSESHNRTHGSQAPDAQLKLLPQP